MDHEMLYTAINAFLKATRNIVWQLEQHEATVLLERTALLEINVRVAYERKDRKALRSLGQHADDLAVEILARLARRSNPPLLEPEFQTLQGTFPRA